MRRLGEAEQALAGAQLGSIEAARCNGVAPKAQPSVLVLTGEPGRTQNVVASNGAELIIRAMVRSDVSSL